MDKNKSTFGYLLFILIMGHISCSDLLYASCIPCSFTENYARNINKEDVFFIKGVAADVHEYGRTIKVIEDLKGNFVGDSCIFVWGDGVPSDETIVTITVERADVITEYHEKDTLIMILNPVDGKMNILETLGDYSTITCAKSVLKLSNGFVSGNIYPWIHGTNWEPISIPWEDLQEELLSILSANQSFNIISYIYQWNGTIFFDNPENKVAKLSFYSFSGSLVHEGVSTSNSYHPGLTGNAYICRIKINDKLKTIKYIMR